MLKHLRPAIMMIVLFTILCGLIYPLGMTGVSQTLFPHQANGSLIEKGGKVIGSELIGQNFTSAKYFHGRISTTTTPYDAGNTAASNFGPTAKPLIARVKKDTAALHAEIPRPRYLSISSPVRPAASTPISRPPLPCFRCRALPGRAVWTRRCCAGWWANMLKPAFSASSASPMSTC